MAADIKLIYDSPIMECDVKLQDGDLLREEGLETAVIMSIFTDRRAKVDDPVEDPTDLRGWWGDQVTSYANEQIGSRLWLLERQKTTQKVLNMAKAYIQESLQWLVDDRVAQYVYVETWRQSLVSSTDMLCFKVIIVFGDGSQIEMPFLDVWNAQFGLS